MALSNLRKRLNDSHIGRIVNESKIGKAFEISSLALAIEAMIDISRVQYQEVSWFDGLGTTVLMPIAVPIIAASFYNKRKENPGAFNYWARNRLDQSRQYFSSI